MKYQKQVYLTLHESKSHEEELYFLAWTDKNDAIDDADEEGCDVAVYELVRTYKPSITRKFLA